LLRMILVVITDALVSTFCMYTIGFNKTEKMMVKNYLTKSIVRKKL
jgi:hypothetical protein